MSNRQSKCDKIPADRGLSVRNHQRQAQKSKAAEPTVAKRAVVTKEISTAEHVLQQGGSLSDPTLTSHAGKKGPEKRRRF